MNLDQNFKEFIKLLNKYEVRYLLIGGYAVAAHGYPRFTQDIDLLIEPSEKNAASIILAIKDFGLGSLGLTKNDFLEKEMVIQLGYPPNRIDILTGAPGLNFELCWADRKEILLDQVKCHLISLKFLRENKMATNRDKDIVDLKNLPET